MGGFRSKGFTTISTCAQIGRVGAQLISSSFALHPSTLEPVYQPFTLRTSSNMSTVEVERPVLGSRRRILTGFSMPKSKACRKLVFDASPVQNDREEDGTAEDSADNYLQEHLQRQSQRWGFNFSTGEPLTNGRVEWVAESEERVPAYYREVRRNPRAGRRNIMSARRSESTEQQHSADNGFLAGGQVNNTRVIPANNLVVPLVSAARPETETASVAVSTSSVHRLNGETLEGNNHGCNSVQAHNNGISNSSRPSTSLARNTQSHIDDHFSQRKRRSSSEDSSAKRSKSLPDRLDRPRSAPAAVATSS